MIHPKIACLALAGSLAVTAIPAAPALADGAASTRNIILGGAAVGAALLIINHNRKVHEKYAEYDRRQAQTQAEANNAEAAYSSEHQAYLHEAAVAESYKHEVALQHQEVMRLRHEVAMSRRPSTSVAAAPVTGPLVAGARVTNPAPVRVASNAPSFGWGAY